MTKRIDVQELGLLKDELEGLFDQFRDQVPEDVQKSAYEQIRQMKASDILNEAVKEGDVLPDFVLPDHNGNLVSSVDLRAKGPIVIIFFRGSWCGFCDTTLRMVRKYTPHFQARGATVVAISPQTVEKAAQTVKDAGLNFSVLSDNKSEYAQLLNIAFIVEDMIKPVYEHFKVSPQEQNGDDSLVLPIPATYVVQPNGRVSYSFLETDFTKRAEPVDILNALPRLQTHRRRSLRQRLDFEISRLQDKLPEDSLRVMFNEVEKLKKAGIEDNAMRVGEKAPDFKLPDRNGQMIDSRKLRKRGPLVVTFNHGHKSPLCMIQLEAMHKYLSKFEAKGATLLSIAPCFSNDLYQAATYSGAQYHLLSDSDNNKVMRQFGLDHRLPGDVFGLEGEVELPMAATFVIDRSGYVVYSHVSVDPTKRAEPSSVLKALPNNLQPKQQLKRGPFSFMFGGRLPARGLSVSAW